MHRRQVLVSLAEDRRLWARDHSRWALSAGSLAIVCGFFGLFMGRAWFLGLLVFVPVALWHLRMVCAHQRAEADLRRRVNDAT